MIVYPKSLRGELLSNVYRYRWQPLVPDVEVGEGRGGGGGIAGHGRCCTSSLFIAVLLSGEAGRSPDWLIRQSPVFVGTRCCRRPLGYRVPVPLLRSLGDKQLAHKQGQLQHV